MEWNFGTGGTGPPLPHSHYANEEKGTEDKRTNDVFCTHQQLFFRNITRVGNIIIINDTPRSLRCWIIVSTRCKKPLALKNNVNYLLPVAMVSEPIVGRKINNIKILKTMCKKTLENHRNHDRMIFKCQWRRYNDLERRKKHITMRPRNTGIVLVAIYLLVFRTRWSPHIISQVSFRSFVPNACF